MCIQCNQSLYFNMFYNINLFVNIHQHCKMLHKMQCRNLHIMGIYIINNMMDLDTQHIQKLNRQYIFYLLILYQMDKQSHKYVDLPINLHNNLLVYNLNIHQYYYILCKMSLLNCIFNKYNQLIFHHYHNLQHNLLYFNLPIMFHYINHIQFMKNILSNQLYNQNMLYKYNQKI